MRRQRPGRRENGLLDIFGCLKKEGLQTENMFFRLFLLPQSPEVAVSAGRPGRSTGKRNVSPGGKGLPARPKQSGGSGAFQRRRQ